MTAAQDLFSPSSSMTDSPVLLALEMAKNYVEEHVSSPEKIQVIDAIAKALNTQRAAPHYHRGPGSVFARFDELMRELRDRFPDVGNQFSSSEVPEASLLRALDNTLTELKALKSIRK